ncbi:MAG: TfoX/Sxy family protein [Verrucomicrobia bacterium]|nr:TfoX/Sxy family protein [Verrucomicrobiota bacterium]
MAVSDDFLNYVVDQLRPWGAVSVRRMFGGAGLYREGKMFGLIAEDVAYLKVDDSNRADFVKAGSAPFNPYPDKGKTTVMSYYEIPPEVLENPAELSQWAQRSFEIQGQKKEKPGKRHAKTA